MSRSIFDIDRELYALYDEIEEAGGEITPERMKGQSQSKNNTQLWMRLVIEARSDAVKSNIAQEPGMSGP